MNPNFFDQSFEMCQGAAAQFPKNQKFAQFLYQETYKNKKLPIANLSENFYRFKESFSYLMPKIKTQQTAIDGTTKFLMEMSDAKTVETVLIPFYKKFTVCLSSQVGCAMGCSFCYTAKQGLARHLSAAEITGQYLRAWQWVKENRPDKAVKPNIVFMGQGEPLHNFDALKLAIQNLLHVSGLDLSRRQITVSTSGYMPGIKRFHELGQVNFALSLHSPFNDERSELIPLNKAYPIEEIFLEIKNIIRAKKQFINLEYLVIDEFNNTERHADALAKLIGDLPVIINLIPFNPFPGSKWKRPTDAQVETFKQHLVKYKFPVMVRITKGDDILAACGQLNSTLS
jgi:23S rRNA (adenine2503-C2)-methyltransferase